MKFLRKKLMCIAVGAAVSIAPFAPIITSCAKEQTVEEIHIVEPSSQEKCKEPEAGVLFAEYKFELKKEGYKANQFDITITDSTTNKALPDITFTSEDVQGKVLICKAQWKKDAILSRTCTFDVKFKNVKDNWTQEIKGLSLKYTSNKELERISIVPNSFKDTYNYGDTLDTSGLLVEIKAKGLERTETVDYGFTTEPENGVTLTHDNITLTVNCGGLSTFAALTINKLPLSTSFYSDKPFKVGERVHLYDIEAEVNYTDGSWDDIKDECVFPEIDEEAGTTLTEVGPNTFSVYWKRDPEVSTSFAILADEGDLQQLQITLKDKNKTWAKNDKFSKSDFTVEAIYPSGYSEVITNYTVSPNIPDAGLTLTAGEHTFTFSYTDVNGNSASKDLILNVVDPVLKEISVSCRRRCYYGMWDLVPSDFTVTAYYTNMPARTIPYDQSGNNGFSISPEPFLGKIGSADNTPEVIFTYKLDSITKKATYHTTFSKADWESVTVVLAKDSFDVGEQITKNDIYVYAKFLDQEYPERLDYAEWDFLGYCTDPAIPYTFTDEDAALRKRKFNIWTRTSGEQHEVKIGDRITINPSVIVEMYATPRSSQQYYVGDTLETDTEIKVDVKFKSGKTFTDYRNFETEETFPYTFTSADVPNKSFVVKKGDVKCECNFPVAEHEGASIKAYIDPTYVGKYNGKTIDSLEIPVGTTWATVQEQIDINKLEILDNRQNRRQFSYWSFADTYDPIDDQYHFHGNEIITARYQDTMNDDDLIRLEATIDSKLTFTDLDSRDNLMYSINRNIPGSLYEKWIRPKKGDVVEIAKGTTLYLRADSLGHLESHLSMKIEGQVFVKGTARALLHGGLPYGSYNEPDETTTFAHLFENSSGLASVSKDFFPFEQINPGMYENAFANCIIMYDCPDLPAQALKPRCYANMFSGCRNLICVPSNFNTEHLKYSIYPDNCMNGMFKNCESLTQPGRFDFDSNTQFEPWCFTSMYENDFSANALTQHEPKDTSPWYDFFTIPDSVPQDVSTFANNMVTSKGGNITPIKGTKYWANLRYKENDMLYSFSTRGGRYYRESKSSRKGADKYNDPRLWFESLPTYDEGNEWYNPDECVSNINLIRGNGLKHGVWSDNDNYRQMIQKVAFKIVLDPHQEINAYLDMQIHLWAYSNWSIFFTSTHNRVSYEIYQSSNPNWWPQRIGDAYAANWRHKQPSWRYDLESLVTEALDVDLKNSSTTKDCAYKYPIHLKNTSDHQQVFTLFFIFNSCVDGNDESGVKGDKSGWVGYKLFLRFNN